MSSSKRVTLVEVGPRDGLQNESRILSTEDKVELVNSLAEAGFQYIEVSSFVHPKWIPALADADEVFARIQRQPGVVYSALVPNERGLERALKTKVDMVNVFMSASESHNRANINKTMEETYSVLKPVVQGAKAAGLPVRGYVSTAFGCPYEGDVAISQVVTVSERLLSMGVDELSIGDTIGVAVPTQVTALVTALESITDVSKLALHFHDTRGTAMANIVAGLACGVTVYDASVGGLGGCPYAPGAAGNVATEDVLYLLDKMGIETGVERQAVDNVAEWLEGQLAKPLPSHARAVRRGEPA